MREHAFLDRIDRWQPVRRSGRVNRIGQTHFEASGPACTVGDICAVGPSSGRVLAQVAAVDRERIVLTRLEGDAQVRLGARVELARVDDIKCVGDGFAGRAIDALRRPIDSARPVEPVQSASEPHRSSPIERLTPSRRLDTGIRAIDGLLTLAEGQRIGIFAASGVGKTSLIEQLMTQIACDRCIVCLVGERGREVEALWRAVSRRDDSDRFTLVAATSDESPAMRARCVDSALALADRWRDHGDHVLLIVDSVTRLAMALREIGLAAGEPPTMRAYTPNVFSVLPAVVERCGPLRGKGAITAVMTILSETDDVDDPVVELMKSLLDGHIVLSRVLAEKGQFPAIDLSRSISRLASGMMHPRHASLASDAVALLGRYEESRILIESGLYKEGASPELDRAISVRARILAFLRQPRDVSVTFDETLVALRTALHQRAQND